MILATIETNDGQIRLLAETGQWDGGKNAEIANKIATMNRAKPEHGDPVLWVVRQVAAEIQGAVEVPYLDKYDPTKDKDRVY